MGVPPRGHSRGSEGKKLSRLGAPRSLRSETLFSSSSLSSRSTWMVTSSPSHSYCLVTLSSLAIQLHIAHTTTMQREGSMQSRSCPTSHAAPTEEQQPLAIPGQPQQEVHLPVLGSVRTAGPAHDEVKRGTTDADDHHPTVQAAGEAATSGIRSPFRWVGSKQQLRSTLLRLFPTEMDIYVEPFLGGGSVLISVLVARDEGAIAISGGIHASDKNPSLINFWKRLQEDTEPLIASIESVCTQYNMAADQEHMWRRAADRYWLRVLDLDHAFLFIFLVYTCFSGVYRESAKKGFNAAWSKKATVRVDTDNVRRVAALIRRHRVQFECRSFEERVPAPTADSFTYLDPPYKKKGGFVGYVAGGFPDVMHERLVTFCNVDLKDSHFILSNSDDPWVKHSFPATVCHVPGSDEERTAEPRKAES